MTYSRFTARNVGGSTHPLLMSVAMRFPEAVFQKKKQSTISCTKLNFFKEIQFFVPRPTPSLTAYRMLPSTHRTQHVACCPSLPPATLPCIAVHDGAQFPMITILASITTIKHTSMMITIKFATMIIICFVITRPSVHPASRRTSYPHHQHPAQSPIARPPSTHLPRHPRPTRTSHPPAISTQRAPRFFSFDCVHSI